MGPIDAPAPHTRPADRPEIVPAVPALEVTRDVDVAGVWRPHREPRAVGVGMGAERPVQVAVRALVEEVQVDLAERRWRGHRHERLLPVGERYAAG